MVLDKVSVVQGETLEKELNELDEIIFKGTLSVSMNIREATPSVPKVIFDPLVYKDIQGFGIISKGIIFTIPPVYQYI